MDLERRVVRTRAAGRDDPAEITYDTLLIACGARHAYFGHDAWEPHAPGRRGTFLTNCLTHEAPTARRTRRR
jgi:NADH dehydrogenase FAD-containing subunit